MDLLKRFRVALVVLLATAGMLVTSTGVVAAASVKTPSASSSVVTTYVKLPANLAAFVKGDPSSLGDTKASPAAIAKAQALLAQHPIHPRYVFYDKNHNVVYPTATSHHSSLTQPDVSFGVNWWGVDLYLSETDVHNIWDIIWTTGLGGAGAALCAPGVLLAIVCSVVGAVIGYVVAEAIWNYSQWNCGLDIKYNWTGSWNASLWACQ